MMMARWMKGIFGKAEGNLVVMIMIPMQIWKNTKVSLIPDM